LINLELPYHLAAALPRGKAAASSLSTQVESGTIYMPHSYQLWSAPDTCCLCRTAPAAL